MPVHIHATDCYDAARRALQIAIEQTVRVLLEEKHLYQSASVDALRVVNVHSIHGSAPEAQRVRHFANVGNWPWYTQDQMMVLTPVSAAPAASDYRDRHVSWRSPDFRSYCGTCDRLEPFNLASATNMFNSRAGFVGGYATQAGTTEVFVLAYVCQGCKGPPEVFTIRRVGQKLTLCGRAPMEHVAVPKVIPPSVSKFFSGAVIAHQSGQTLAGLFLLRTLCEQWARLFTDSTARADAALDAYLDALPDDFKGRFPSLRVVYGELSDALHGARGDAALFDATAQMLTEHFGARKLFKLPDPVTRA